ncbi:MAG: DUF4079 domain-containing protein [Merismopedia sp. SIO2A8]|nr:DUF4079 domain-containing protein [Symploca sp. SIO2B6]NET49387.1 DUF4079 domain-containing protein [Merismopedia sp. SIO2A8]
MTTLTFDAIKPWLNFFHPLMMWGLLAMMVYALYLGGKVSQIRSSNTDAETRKTLVKAKVKDKHHQVGALILALMVLGNVGGMAVTYINNGKLFVGPHLLVGLGMTCMIAIAAALTPFMQKGQDWARYSHIGLNVGLLGLFVWQAVSGMDILQRIIDRMFAA